jgi:hypothetical protein
MISMRQYIESGIIIPIAPGGQWSVVSESFQQGTIVVSVMFRCNQLPWWFCANEGSAINTTDSKAAKYNRVVMSLSPEG